MGKDDQDWQWRADPEEHLPPWKRPIVAEEDGLSWRGWLAILACGASLVLAVVSWVALDETWTGFGFVAMAIACARTTYKEANG